MLRILILCHGNLCRSPMAEGYLRKLLYERGIGEVEVRSAGVGALNGYPASEAAHEVGRRHGFSLEGHRARQVRIEDLRGADWVLVMERYQQAAARQHLGEEAGKVRLLGEYSKSGGPEVDDPYGEDVECYEAVFTMIKDAIENFLGKEIIQNGRRN